jgi:hypothetical protein
MTRRKDGSPGNARIDREWMDQHAEELVEVDGLAFNARTQWSGLNKDYGTPWQIPPDDRKCTVTAYVRDYEGSYILDAKGERLRRPCTRWAIKGGIVCVDHGGGIEHVKAKALERLVLAADSAVGRLIELATDDTTPAAERIRAINSLLDRAGIQGGMSLEVGSKGFEKVLKTLVKGVPPAGEGDDE